MLWHSFEQLIASIESFELADVPVHLASNEIAGVVSLPVRVRTAFGAPTAAESEVGLGIEGQSGRCCGRGAGDKEESV